MAAGQANDPGRREFEHAVGQQPYAGAGGEAMEPLLAEVEDTLPMRGAPQRARPPWRCRVWYKGEAASGAARGTLRNC